ncbi:unnamed protein product [Ambrosiozyma monospora]|uniref:Unnamed protein product n=1 Tax=Ambrosiozyma monospora TaxID=43982 RepID=A0A9W7DIS7_AMBMO|nr:unnamed protein product [Ambrosiozyma monospora]
MVLHIDKIDFIFADRAQIKRSIWERDHFNGSVDSVCSHGDDMIDLSLDAFLTDEYLTGLDLILHARTYSEGKILHRGDQQLLWLSMKLKMKSIMMNKWKQFPMHVKLLKYRNVNR